MIEKKLINLIGTLLILSLYKAGVLFKFTLHSKNVDKKVTQCAITLHEFCPKMSISCYKVVKKVDLENEDQFEDVFRFILVSLKMLPVR